MQIATSGHVSVQIGAGSRPIKVTAPGINYASFESLEQAYGIFGGICPLIFLNDDGHKHIAICLEHIGYRSACPTPAVRG